MQLCDSVRAFKALLRVSFQKEGTNFKKLQECEAALV